MTKITDSILLSVKSKHTHDELVKKLDDLGIMDLSNYPKTHELFSDKHRSVPGFMKDESGRQEKYLEIVSLAPKLYAIKSQVLEESANNSTKTTFRAKGRFYNTFLTCFILKQYSL